MKNKLFKAFTVLLLTLTFICGVAFNCNAEINESGVSVYRIGSDNKPFNDNDDDEPRKP